MTIISRLILVPVILMTMIMGWAQTKPTKIPKPDFSQYKRIHQKALDLIRTDQEEIAVQFLNKVSKNLPMDAETHYMLAVAYCELGKIKEAESSVERALELGLPVGRIIGGIHNGLDAIRNRSLMQRLIHESGKYPVHGPMLANLSGTSVVIWLRTAGPSRVSVEAYTDPLILSDRVEAFAFAKRENDHVAKVILKGLKPQTTYQYIVSIDGQKNESPKQRFTTFNQVGNAGNFRLAFGGGAGFVPQHEYIWNTIADTEPQALFQLGDNVYIDNTDVMDMHHYCYYRRQSRSEYRALVSEVSVFSIWDDHDFGLNDCSGGPGIETPKWKRSTYEIFRDNWANPAYGGGDKQPGIWWDTYINDVHFICIDGRYYRTNPKTTKGKLSMLGSAQKYWLLNTIKKSKGTFKVLVSPVPWVFKAKGDSKDTWNGFKDERNEIFQFLKENNIKGVLLMSADRHRSDLWKIDRSDDYSLYEFNSSRLTNQHVHKTMDEAIYSYNAKQSFGTVDFDTQAKDPTATYAVHSIDGEQIYKFTVKRSQLE